MRIMKWFKPVSLQDLAFAFQRLTGFILAMYLILHLAFLSTLSDPLTYESLIAITVSPTFLPLDSLLVLCGIYHGLNGIRVIIHELGYLHEHRKALLVICAILTVIAWLYATWVMYEVV
ncbi:MAG: succinate dehydrogenase [Archaeoglobales archaeon]|nr:succinate dehydrogenase [Archaeoglobales archaeon]